MTRRARASRQHLCASRRMATAPRRLRTVRARLTSGPSPRSETMTGDGDPGPRCLTAERDALPHTTHATAAAGVRTSASGTGDDAHGAVHLATPEIGDAKGICGMVVIRGGTETRVGGARTVIKVEIAAKTRHIVRSAATSSPSSRLCRAKSARRRVMCPRPRK